MITRSEIRDGLTTRPVQVVLVTTAVVVGVQFVLFYGTGLEARTLVTDPAEIVHFPSWYGALSHLGVLSWWSAGTVAAFGAALAPAGHPLRRHLTRLAIASAFLSLDDLFRFHETWSDFIGVPESILYLAYLPLIIWWLYRAMPDMEPERFLLILTAVGLGGSLFSDVVFEDIWPLVMRGDVVIEEGLKFLGIFAWTAAMVVASARVVRLRGGDVGVEEPSLPS